MYLQIEMCDCNIIRAIKARTMWGILQEWEVRNAWRVLVGSNERKRQPGRRRSSWKVVTVNLLKIKSAGMDWLQVTEGKANWQVLVNIVTNLRVP